MKEGAARVARLAGPFALAALAACGPAGSGASVERLYEQQCASCHGSDGRGAAARRGLEPKLDLSRSILVANGARGLLFERIAFGYNTMPGFAHKLPQGDLERLADYVTRFAKPAE